MGASHFPANRSIGTFLYDAYPSPNTGVTRWSFYGDAHTLGKGNRGIRDEKATTGQDGAAGLGDRIRRLGTGRHHVAWLDG
jgi:hypothetical protein